MEYISINTFDSNNLSFNIKIGSAYDHVTAMYKFPDGTNKKLIVQTSFMPTKYSHKFDKIQFQIDLNNSSMDIIVAFLQTYDLKLKEFLKQYDSYNSYIESNCFIKKKKMYPSNIDVINPSIVMEYDDLPELIDDPQVIDNPIADPQVVNDPVDIPITPELENNQLDNVYIQLVKSKQFKNKYKTQIINYNTSIFRPLNEIFDIYGIEEMDKLFNEYGKAKYKKEKHGRFIIMPTTWICKDKKTYGNKLIARKIEIKNPDDMIRSIIDKEEISLSKPINDIEI
ncbi:MAG: hypothetical protein Edafosvirus14_8 [Edafosvirus sp.]|uniref:Uncharacterized protein n=1 Tax=Edafosvirus sp. TaxID=2487765 RepID=A0A3G4ZWU3_9VIRU|nr:MAG: hypothetical protein Edafosvirus14_8 [Edafosvirus sp.]